MDFFLSALIKISGIPYIFGWALLIVFPKSRMSQKIFQSHWLPLIFALAYAVIIVPTLIVQPNTFLTLANPSLDSIRLLLGSPEGAGAGWMHFLCLDMFLGINIWRRALAEEIAPMIFVPCLIMTLFLAPLGWLIFELTQLKRNRPSASNHAHPRSTEP